MLHRAITSLEKKHFSPILWIVSFVGILFIRFSLETISSPPLSGAITFDVLTLIHYALFYIPTALALILTVGFFIPKQKKFLWNITPYAILITSIPPIIDLIASVGAGSSISYLTNDKNTFLNSFLTFFGSQYESGITLGIKTEIALLLFGIGLIVWHYSRSTVRTGLSILSSYCVLFIFVSLPSFITAIGHLITEGAFPSSFKFVSVFFLNSFNESLLPALLTNPSLLFSSTASYYYTLFNSILGQIFLILSLIFGSFVMYSMNRGKFLALMHNIRPGRLMHYLGVAILGGACAFSLYTTEFSNSIYAHTISWVTILSAITLIISISSAWIAAVCTNDLIDIESDAISETKRPLIQGTLTRDDMRAAAYIFQSIALIAAILLGGTITYLIVVFSLLYLLYSLPPLQLKKIPLLSSVMIATACTSIMLSGFFFLGSTFALIQGLGIRAFPGHWLLALWCTFFVIVHIREIKDIRADRAVGIHTVATILGERKVKITLGILGGIALAISASIILASLTAYLVFGILGLIAAIMMCLKNPPQIFSGERGPFALYFLWLGTLIAFLLT